MIKACILGTGNVGTHLFRAFSKSTDIEVTQMVGRNAEALKNFEHSTNTTTDFTAIDIADIYIIAVNDDAIFEISQYLKHLDGLVVHTSGSVSMYTLSGCRHYGVFYPLQTFSKDREVNMRAVPFCIEAHHETDMKMLTNLAAIISDVVYKVDSKRRKALHLAAVFVNNFTNHVYHIGQNICEDNELPTSILYPLIQETVDKIAQLSPYTAQTGPARRGDTETIKKHLDQMKNAEYKEVYRVMSESICKLYS